MVVVQSVMELVTKQKDLLKIVDEVRELMKPHRVRICADAVEGRFLENRFTHECRICHGVIPLKWSGCVHGDNQRRSD